MKVVYSEVNCLAFLDVVSEPKKDSGSSVIQLLVTLLVASVQILINPNIQSHHDHKAAINAFRHVDKGRTRGEGESAGM